MCRYFVLLCGSLCFWCSGLLKALTLLPSKLLPWAACLDTMLPCCKRKKVSSEKVHFSLASNTVFLLFFGYTICLLLPVGLISFLTVTTCTNIVCYSSKLLMCQLCMCTPEIPCIRQSKLVDTPAQCKQ